MLTGVVMTDETRDIGHLGELLSGFIDDELTQQDRQRVRLHVESCTECAAELAGLAALREKVGRSSLGAGHKDTWRETMDDNPVKASRGIGWLLIIVGCLLAGGVFVYDFITHASMSPMEKLIVVSLYGGALFLFVSVLRQRLIERKSDKYKDVEI